MNPVRNLHINYFVEKLNFFDENPDKIKGVSVNF